MAKKAVKTQTRVYQSVSGIEGRIRTDIYQTEPRTVITINEKLDDTTNNDLRFLIDNFLKERGY